MQVLKKVISNFLYMTFGEQGTIRWKEYIKGLYRYPKNMIGRRLPNSLPGTDVLVFAAHPDDEVLGLSAMMNRHLAKGEKITVVYVTDGTGRSGDSWQRTRHLSEQIAQTRYEEGVNGLSVLNIPKQNLICLGFPDGGTHRYLKEISKDITSLMSKLAPKKVYVHCIEGGHHDHDLVSVVVKSVCYHLNYFHLFEWAEYSPSYPLAEEKVGFPALIVNREANEQNIDFTDKELMNKKRMLTCHASQDVASLFRREESIRKANVNYLREELVTNSQVMTENWSYLIDYYLKHMKSKQRKSRKNKDKHISQQGIKKI